VQKLVNSVFSRRPNALSGRFLRIAAVGLLLTAGLGSAWAISPKSSPRKGTAPAARGIQPLQSFACTTLGINCISTVSGALTSDDCVGPDPLSPGDTSFYDAWTFQGTAGQNVTITMSGSFDTFLWLFDSNGNELDYNDDISDTNTNSRINFHVDVTGTYTIKANS